jgi:hypothetical protein
MLIIYMENMKSLADRLREQLVNPAGKRKKDKLEKASKKVKRHKIESAILEAILAYDNSENKSLVHARFDEQTVRLMNQFKMAANVDVTRLVSFAVRHLFETYPELKTIIKQFIQNTEL